jgi:uncharacterized damage-inducible protein DinB
MNLDKSVYDNFYKGYIDKVIDKDWITGLEEEGRSMIDFFDNIPDGKSEFRYEDGKWSVKEVLMHLVDCERIMAYRALCFARGDKTELPGFDEKHYGNSSGAENLSLTQIRENYWIQRRSNILMFQSFTVEMMDNQGSANGIILSARALAYIIAGHAYHHRSVLTDRYLG